MRRHLGTALFGLALLSFLLPFARVHGPGLDSAENLEGLVSFRGYDLVIGKPFPESFKEVIRGAALGPAEDFHFASEPFAVLAALAALAGLGLGLLRRTERAPRGALWAASAGAVAMLLLGLSPFMRLLGLFRVNYKPGYWLAFASFIAAAVEPSLIRPSRQPEVDAKPPPMTDEPSRN
jgi:hypothetical protein